MRVEDLRRTPVPELQRLFVDEARDLPSGGLSALKDDPPLLASWNIIKRVQRTTAGRPAAGPPSSIVPAGPAPTDPAAAISATPVAS